MALHARSAQVADLPACHPQQAGDQIADDFAAALGRCDFLLAPACPITAWKAGEISDPLTAYKMDILTLSLNLAGLPGLCLPAGKGKDSGLPVGLQIMGRAFDEEGLVRTGSTLEAALPHPGMPPM